LDVDAVLDLNPNINTTMGVDRLVDVKQSVNANGGV